MPTIHETSGRDMVIYQQGEELPPALLAIKNGNLEAFVQSLYDLDTVDEVQMTHASQLYTTSKNQQYGYEETNNIAVFAAKCGHSHLVDYMYSHQEQLGLTTNDFISVVDVANSPEAANELKCVVEKYPDVIEAYNKEMRVRGISYHAAETPSTNEEQAPKAAM
jgi:hypothetical protein